MAYDTGLAQRLGQLLANEPNVTEKAMFGGLAFLVDGHMAVCANSRGTLMVRVDPARADSLLERAGVSRMVMRGRELDGWLTLDADAEMPEEELRNWAAIGVAHARSLPPK